MLTWKKALLLARINVFIPENSPNTSRTAKIFALAVSIAICPEGALSFGDKYRLTSGRLCKQRWFIEIDSRLYKYQDIPDDIIAKLIDMLAYTPKGGNINDLHFRIVSTSKCGKNILSRITIQQIFTEAKFLHIVPLFPARVSTLKMCSIWYDEIHIDCFQYIIGIISAISK